VPQPPAAGSIIPPNCKLLQGLSPRDRELLVAAGKTQKFSAGSVVTAQGDPADRLYILITGCVRFFYTAPDGRKFLLLLVAPGDAFGAATILPSRSAYLVSCAAVTASRVVSWDRATLRGFTERFPQILHNALTIAGEYITWYMAAHVAQSTHTAPQRLGAVLLDQARHRRENPRRGGNRSHQRKSRRRR
jgi:CRP/FNR family transcriptional regulator, cyclic AMP receptor protein